MRTTGSCEYCNKPYEGNVRAAKCGFPSCLKWVHEPCADTSQVSKTGFWYCKSHITEIPIEQRVFNLSKKDRDSERESSDDDAKTSTDLDGEKPSNQIESNQEVPLINVQESSNNDEEPLEVSDTNILTNSREALNIPQSCQLNHSNINNKRQGLDDLKKKLKKSNKDPKLLVPYDNGEDDNPFSNFNCESCQGEFTKKNKGVLCINCRNTYHVNCLNSTELEDKKNSRFVCQFCIQDNIRLERMRKRQDREQKAEIKKKAVKDDVYYPKKRISVVSSTMKQNKGSREKKVEKYFDSSSCSLNSDMSEEENDDKIFKLYNKLKSLIKSRNRNSKNKINIRNSSDSSEDESSEIEISQSDAMITLLKSSQEDRNRNKYEKLPLVEYVDTKWSIFYDLFSQSRKLFSDSENVLRIQKSIKCREILDIGGVNLFDPRAYWQAIKLIDKRLNQSYNLLHRETSEIIKLKKLKYESDNKKIIEFINKIVNYSSIVIKYGNKKHINDDRVISHIGNIMPNSMLNGWHKLKSRLEDNNTIVSVSHVADYLSKQVSYITSKMQAEELDPWKENSYTNKTFKRNDFNNKRSYSTFSNNRLNQVSSDSSSTYCWMHKSKGHSSFNCSKLWEMSGKEVSDLARKNGICTFCGHKKHKDCSAAKNLNCKIENCHFKHHILFCYKRVGKNKFKDTQRKNYVRRENSDKNKNPERKEGSQRSFEKPETNSFHRKDDLNNNPSSKETDDSEVEIPNSNMYINNPPKTLRIKNNSNHSVFVDSEPNRIQYHAGNDTTFELFSHNNNEKRTTSCILGVLVVNFLDSNEKVALLLDSGSTVSIIEESLADKLEIKGLWHPLRLNWSSNMSRIDYASRIIKAKVSAMRNQHKEYDLYFRTVKNLNMHEQPFDAKEILELYPHLRKMNLISYSRIYGIIGLDNLWCFDQQKVFKPKNWDPSIPYGIRGPLGDMVMGNLNQLVDIYNFLNENDNSNVSNHVTSSYSYNQSLTEDECQELA